MSRDPRVRGLVEEILETHRTPEEVCQDLPGIAAPRSSIA